MIYYFCFVCGLIGAISFAICTAPQVLKAYKTKSTKDISLGFILLSISGNIFSFVYVLYTNIMANMFQYPIFFNYSVALILAIVLLIFKLKYK